MRILTIALIAFALTACGDKNLKAEDYVTRNRYVVSGCDPVEPVEPAWVVDELPLGSPIDAQMRALRADRLAARAYINSLLAAIRGCRTPPEPAKK